MPYMNTPKRNDCAGNALCTLAKMALEKFSELVWNGLRFSEKQNNETFLLTQFPK